MLLQDILEYNEQFVENKEYAPCEASKMQVVRLPMPSVVSCGAL